MKWNRDLLQPGTRFAKLQSLANPMGRATSDRANEWEVISVHDTVDGIPLVKLQSMSDRTQLKTLSALTLCDRKMYRPTLVEGA